MLKNEREMRQAAIGKAVAARAGNAPDASDFSRAALRLWRQIKVRLQPVIGDRGVEALLRRSLHLTARTFPWLVMAASGNDHVSLEQIEACLAGQETSVAAGACNALLATFTGLLEDLIGESLTARLLGDVWVTPALSLQHEIPS
jgi:hypothetical protein